MSQSQAAVVPRRRGRPRKNVHQFQCTIIRLDSRPRLVVGDVVELCRGCLPENVGKLGIIAGFNEDGTVQILPLGERFAAADGTLSDNSFTKPENLYRRSSFLLNGAAA